MSAERADAVVVGARCAGSAAGIALARAGRHAVVLDRVAFPADTISTHLLWPSGVAELQALGALDRVHALGAPPLRSALAGGGGYTVRAPFPAIDGVDHALCVRRTGLDSALVASARAAGADVRERARVTDLLWAGERVAGVRWEDEDSALHELHAPLVIGSDGRRSTVARLVGADVPLRARPSERACFYGYWRDARPDGRDVAAQWRAGAELGAAFPCDDGLMLVLLQPAGQRADEFRRDLDGVYRASVAAIPGLAERLRGSELVGKVRSATGIESYFRRSAGAGWALAGDAGHFKDPVTAQGIRDALRYGRLLGEATAPVLGDPVRLDTELRAWERRRELECLETYQWTDRLARAEPMTPLEVELYRRAAEDERLAGELLEVFCRVRAPLQLLTARRFTSLAAGALRRGHGGSRLGVVRAVGAEVAIALGDLRERRAVRSAPRGDIPAQDGEPPRDPGHDRPPGWTRSRDHAVAR
jgi:2-polyprenyl-6-methoxyphenol hydroxylase-like FAD-dependent oxidoreductase